MLDVATELDLALVPGLESELRCESKHMGIRNNVRRPDGTHCTVAVVARYTTCCQDMLICQAKYEHLVSLLNTSRFRHPFCGKLFQDCAKVHPV